MKAMMKSFFDTEKEEKISEKTFLSRITASVIIIIVCLIAMSISAYAYFSCDVSSPKETIRSASYELAVAPPSDMESADIYELKNDSDGDKEYVFTLSTVGSSSTASVGYCKIVVKNERNSGDAQSFYTKPIWLVEDLSKGKVDTREVKIIIPSGKTVYVSFVSEWGSCSKEPISEEIEIK